MEKVYKELKKLSDQKYQKFQSSLIPNINNDSIIGVRIPLLRKYAKEFSKSEDAKIFLNTLPHKYYEENILHALIINDIKNYDFVIKEINKFLPYVDNWAVCDILAPKVFKEYDDKLLKHIIKWVKSKRVYTARFGIEMLMRLYLDENFKEEYLEIPLLSKLDDYYLRMMQAWFYATALAKRWDETIVYIKDNRLDVWTHNKTIQKAIESYRIGDKEKAYLRKYKR